MKNMDCFKNCKDKYKELEKNGFQKLNLYVDEQVMHCIDESESKYNLFRWIVTNKGRVWSLSQNKWLNPRNQRGYWRIANVYVHELVSHYFLTTEEKNTLEIVSEHNKKCDISEIWHLHIHHLKPVIKMDSTKMTKEERIHACMAVNYKENLILQIKETDHKNDHKIMKGIKPIYDGEKVECDTCTSIMINSKPNIVYTKYNEKTNRELEMIYNIPTLTSDEEIEYEKKTNNSFLIQ